MDDLISRQAAIDELVKMLGYCFQADEEVIDAVVTTLKELPSAQPILDARDTQYNLPIGTDLISRKAALNALHARFRDGFDKDKWWNSTHVLGAIEGLPPAEPKIIRCKDCKHWIPYDWMFNEEWQSRNIDDYPEDEIGCNWSDMAMKANDFCSRAERRTE